MDLRYKDVTNSNCIFWGKVEQYVASTLGKFAEEISKT